MSFIGMTVYSVLPKHRLGPRIKSEQGTNDEMNKWRKTNQTKSTVQKKHMWVHECISLSLAPILPLFLSPSLSLPLSLFLSLAPSCVPVSVFLALSQSLSVCLYCLYLFLSLSTLAPSCLSLSPTMSIFSCLCFFVSFSLLSVSRFSFCLSPYLFLIPAFAHPPPPSPKQMIWWNQEVMLECPVLKTVKWER